MYPSGYSVKRILIVLYSYGYNMVMGTAKDYTPIDSVVLEIIHQRREAAGMSGRALSVASGIGNNRMAIILRGETPAPTLGELAAIAEALGMRGSDLIEAAEIQLAVTHPDFYAVAAHDPGTDHELEAEQLEELP